MELKIAAVIPARMESQRLPRKPMILIKGKPMIVRVFEAVCQTGLFDQIFVATDSFEIKQAVENEGGVAVMTAENCPSGTDRVLSILPDIDCDVIVNVQGDEPFITRNVLADLISAFQSDDTQIASLMHSISAESELSNPNVVKVVVDFMGRALYFSRSVIPYNRDNSDKMSYYKHIGVYAFRKESLLKFSSLKQGRLEKLEKLEQLRWLENGYSVKMVETDYNGFGIDTEEDYLKALKLFSK